MAFNPNINDDGVPYIAKYGETVLYKEVLPLELAANSLNALMGGSSGPMYDPQFMPAPSHDVYGNIIPDRETKRTVILRGRWARDPERNLAIFEESYKKYSDHLDGLNYRGDKLLPYYDE